jgi:hypothetical protein
LIDFARRKGGRSKDLRVPTASLNLSLSHWGKGNYFAFPYILIPNDKALRYFCIPVKSDITTKMRKAKKLIQNSFLVIHYSHPFLHKLEFCLPCLIPILQ